MSHNTVRNDAMEDRYSVLIKLVDQLSADEFYSNLNDKRFSPAEVSFLSLLLVYLHLWLIYSGTRLNWERNSGYGFNRLRYATCYLCFLWSTQN